MVEDGARVPIDTLYRHYHNTVKAGGNFPMNKQNLGQALRAEVRSIKIGRMPSSDIHAPRARAYIGLRLLKEGEQPPAPPAAPEPLNGLSGFCPASVRTEAGHGGQGEQL